VPETGSIEGLVGAPAAGLTNQQTWARFGIAISGRIAPCFERRDRIAGFVCPIQAP
jgi:hypothetical protein